MKRTRVVHVQRVHSPENDDVWIDVERLDKLIVENGKGFHYQKTVFTFRWDDEQDDGTWKGSEKRTDIKRITNPDDPTQYVDLPVIKYVDIERGKNFHYQKTRHHFNNTDKNNVRKTHTKTVHGPGDDRLDVEVIDKLSRETRRGVTYQKTVISYVDQGHEQE